MSPPAETAELSEAEMNQLRKKKVDLKMQNEQYLRQHPELTELLQEVISKVCFGCVKELASERLRKFIRNHQTTKQQQKQQALLAAPADPVSFVEAFMIEEDLEAVVQASRDRRAAMSVGTR